MKYLLLFILFVSLFSCRESAVYKDFRSIKSEAWCINDTVCFQVNIPQENAYDIQLSVRHTTDYEMANLWCFVHIVDTANVVYSDTVNMRLAEADGRWLGDGYAIKTIKHPINKQHLRLKSGIHTITIEQGMRIDCLKGIRDIGVSVEDVSMK
jgi:gliding motility-associated lipoprotein GldH